VEQICRARWRPRARQVLVLLFGLAALPVSAAPGLVTGHYVFTNQLSSVCLDGRYPVTIGDISGAELNVTTTARGAVKGSLKVWDMQTPMSGLVKTARGAVHLHLKGRTNRQTMTITAVLVGDKFVGTARTRAGRQRCTLDVSSTAALKARFDLTLTVSAAGRVTGTGTMTACRTNVPITASGSSKTSRSTLNLKGRSVLWKSSGASIEGGFTARWSAKSFGAVVGGRNLTITNDVP
jgi:hypothetical protein